MEVGEGQRVVVCVLGGGAAIERKEWWASLWDGASTQTSLAIGDSPGMGFEGVVLYQYQGLGGVGGLYQY